MMRAKRERKELVARKKGMPLLGVGEHPKLSERSKTLIEGCLEETTSKAYRGYVREFEKWCEEQGVRVEAAEEADLVNYLADLHNKRPELHVASFKGRRSAISTYLHLLKGHRLGESPLVRAAMRSLQKQVPDDPKPTMAEDIPLAAILEELKQMHKKEEDLSYQDKVMRLAILLYVTGLRAADMRRVNLIKSIIPKKVPRPRRGKADAQEMRLKCMGTKEANCGAGGGIVWQSVMSVPEDDSICPLFALQQVAAARPEGADEWLFVKQDGMRYTSDRIRNLIKVLFNKVGVPPDIHVHSLRMAGTTQALKSLPKEEVLKAFRFSPLTQTMSKFYHKPQVPIMKVIALNCKTKRTFRPK